MRGATMTPLGVMVRPLRRAAAAAGWMSAGGVTPWITIYPHGGGGAVRSVATLRVGPSRGIGAGAGAGTASAAAAATVAVPRVSAATGLADRAASTHTTFAAAARRAVVSKLAAAVSTLPRSAATIRRARGAGLVNTTARRAYAKEAPQGPPDDRLDRVKTMLEKGLNDLRGQGAKGPDSSAHQMYVRLHDLDKALRVRGYSMLGVVGGVIFCLGAYFWLFKENIKHQVGRDLSDVASNTLGNKELVLKAEQVSKGVVIQVLTDKETADNAGKFLIEMCSRADTRDAVVNLLQQVASNEQALEATTKFVSSLFLGLFADPTVQTHTMDFLNRIIQQPQTRDAFIQLFSNIFANANFQQYAVEFFRGLFASEVIVNQAGVLAVRATHIVLDTPAVFQHARVFVTGVLEDNSVHAMGGDAIWSAIKYSFTPSWLGGSGEGSDGNLGDAGGGGGGGGGAETSITTSGEIFDPTAAPPLQGEEDAVTKAETEKTAVTGDGSKAEAPQGVTSKPRRHTEPVTAPVAATAATAATTFSADEPPQQPQMAAETSSPAATSAGATDGTGGAKPAAAVAASSEVVAVSPAPKKHAPSATPQRHEQEQGARPSPSPSPSPPGEPTALATGADDAKTTALPVVRNHAAASDEALPAKKKKKKKAKKEQHESAAVMPPRSPAEAQGEGSDDVMDAAQRVNSASRHEPRAEEAPSDEGDPGPGTVSRGPESPMPETSGEQGSGSDRAGSSAPQGGTSSGGEEPGGPPRDPSAHDCSSRSTSGSSSRSDRADSLMTSPDPKPHVEPAPPPPSRPPRPPPSPPPPPMATSSWWPGWLSRSSSKEGADVPGGGTAEGAGSAGERAVLASSEGGSGTAGVVAAAPGDAASPFDDDDNPFA